MHVKFAYTWHITGHGLTFPMDCNCTAFPSTQERTDYNSDIFHRENLKSTQKILN